MKIKSISKQDRPREKLERYGAGRLTDAELLAILLGTGVRGTNVLELARKILRKWQGDKLGSAGLAELSDVHGIGKAKASEIVASLELGRRLFAGKQAAVLLSPKDVWERMIDIRDSKREHLVVFYLDSRSQELKREIVSVGTLDESLAHPREIFEQAVKQNAGSVIVAHNHPSGDLEPSRADEEITKRLVHAGTILGIAVTDHVIVTSRGWKSILTGDHA